MLTGLIFYPLGLLVLVWAYRSLLDPSKVRLRTLVWGVLLASIGVLGLLMGNGTLVKEYGWSLPYMKFTIGYEFSVSLLNGGEDCLLITLLIAIGMHYYKLRTNLGRRKK